MYGTISTETTLTKRSDMDHTVFMAVLYVVQESHYVLRLYFNLLLLLFFQKVISEVTERISFILSHNIRSRCNLIMHQKVS